MNTPFKLNKKRMTQIVRATMAMPPSQPKAMIGELLDHIDQLTVRLRDYRRRTEQKEAEIHQLIPSMADVGQMHLNLP
jgi:hypothetical protein